MRPPPRLLRLLLLLLSARPTSPSEVLPLSSGVTVEYEQRESYSWRWFILPTGNNAGVSIGLVMQRGDNDNFPRHGLVALATAGAVPPGSVSGAEYDPTTYTQHEDPVGPRFKYSWISLSEARPSTDWEVLTLGFDANASRTDPAATQVQLNNVLIGFRCNERDWSGEIPGCRYSLTATLLPFELRHGSRLTAPMAPGTVHVYRITLGTYDSLSLDIDRDGVNASEHLESTAGLVGAALLQRAAWSPPRTLDFPYNLSGASGDLGVLPVETAAMVAYQGDRLWADKGLVSLEGCLAGDAGCRQKPQPSGTGDTADDAEAAKQADLRDNPWAHVLPDGKGYAALHAGAPRSLLQKLCVGPGEGGVYYVTLYADATSGDGRLWAGDGTLATVGGSKGDALTGVDTTGWRRAFSARAAGCWCCEAGACAQQCDAFQGACAGVVMPNATARTVRGYDVAVSALVFTDGAVDAGEDRAGCVGYGQWRRYTITTVGAEGAGLVLSLDADVEGLYAANGRPPTYESHDAVARPPQRNLSIAGCDVTTTNVWHVAVHLGARGAYGTAYTVETLFTLRVRARSAAAYVGDVLTAQSCCGVINLWRVPYVPASHALRANVTVHSGAVHGVFVQYDSCPSYTHGDASQTCDGLCEVAWLTSWDEISGARVERDRLAVTVPMGETVGRNDERRAGAWYVGVKALAGEAAEYTVALSLAAPPSRYAHPYCSHLLRFCASETQHETADGVVTTAADARVPPLSSTSAAGRGGRGVAAAARWWTVGVGVLGVAWLLRPR